MTKKKQFVEFSDIEQAAQIVHNQTFQVIERWCLKFPEMINLLLKLNYFIENHKSESIDSDATACAFTITQEKYLEAPYSMYVCNDLMVKGHYLNALIQARSLLDYFITCKYFHIKPEHAIPYKNREKCTIEGNKKPQWLSMSDMYKVTSTDHFFRQYWGNLLSGITHGKPGTIYFRTKSATSAEGTVVQEMLVVPEFHLKNSFAVINILIPLIYGYLTYREVLFAGHLKDLPSELSEEIKETLKWIKNYQDELLKKNPEMEDWVKEINNLCNIL